jgi:hypothetical protein
MVNTTQLEQSLIDELFARLMQPADPVAPRQIQLERPGPYHVTPQHLIERAQIEAQLRLLVDAAVVQVYGLLDERMAEVRRKQDEAIDLERKRLAEQRAWQEKQERAIACGMCTLSRQARY